MSRLGLSTHEAIVKSSLEFFPTNHRVISIPLGNVTPDGILFYRGHPIAYEVITGTGGFDRKAEKKYHAYAASFGGRVIILCYSERTGRLIWYHYGLEQVFGKKGVGRLMSDLCDHIFKSCAVYNG